MGLEIKTALLLSDLRCTLLATPTPQEAGSDAAHRSHGVGKGGEQMRRADRTPPALHGGGGGGNGLLLRRGGPGLRIRIS